MYSHSTLSKQHFRGSMIYDFIENLNFPAHFKESDTGRYLTSNQANLKFYNLSDPTQLIGHTIKDLDGFMQPFWGNGFVGDVAKMEYQVIHKKHKIIDEKRPVLIQSGKIILQQMEKIPVINDFGRVSGILTLSHDLTNQLSIEHLYQLYKNRYPHKSNAINAFLKHLGLREYFIMLPTDREIQLLLARKYHSSYKELANFLKLKPKTVEIYSAHLSDKLKSHNMSEVTALIRGIKHEE